MTLLFGLANEAQVAILARDNKWSIMSRRMLMILEALRGVVHPMADGARSGQSSQVHRVPLKSRMCRA